MAKLSSISPRHLEKKLDKKKSIRRGRYFSKFIRVVEFSALMFVVYMIYMRTK